MLNQHSELPSPIIKSTKGLSKFKSFSTTFNNHWANLCFSDVQNMTQPLLPKKQTYPLKNYGWKMNLRFEMVPFQVI